MSSTQMTANTIQSKNTTRRKFVWGISILSFFSAIAAAIGFRPSATRNIISCAPESAPKTLKMLTEDGRLVEIDASHLPTARKQISNPELQQWIKK
jgi:hypothetical protein